MKEYKEQTQKEFDEILAHFKRSPHKIEKEFAEQLNIYLNRLRDKSYTKAIDDAVKICKETMGKIPMPSERLSVYVNVIQQLQQLTKEPDEKINS